MKSRVAPLPSLEPTPRGSHRKQSERRAPTLEPAPATHDPAPNHEPFIEPPAPTAPVDRREPLLLPSFDRSAANSEHLEAPSEMAPPVEVAAPEGPLFDPLFDATAVPPDVHDVQLDPPLAEAEVRAMLDVPTESIVHPDFDLGRPLATTRTGSRIDAALTNANRFLDRVPWLLPTVSFSIGWLSFFLFQRGEGLARGIAIIALVGWPWLLAENLLGRWVVARSNGRLSIGAVRFVTQQIQQEILFFALPFLFGAMVLEPGQMLFVAGAAVIAILVSIDPIYLKRIAPHAGWSSALHAYCTFIAALVVLPVALHMPLDQALPLAMAITAGSLLLSLPRMLMAAPSNKLRLFGCAALAAIFPLMWASRAAIPPAGLWVREARVAHFVANLEPGPAVKSFGPGALQSSGAVAFVAVRAPTGLSQAVVFDWHLEGALIDRIPAEISGGREGGFRTYSRKQNFPAESRGNWRVDLRTPQGQLIARMRFTAQ